MSFFCKGTTEYFEPVEISYRDCDGSASLAAELALEQHLEPQFTMPAPSIVEVIYGDTKKRFLVKAKVICIAEEIP